MFGASHGHHLRMRVRVRVVWIFTVVRTWHRIELLAVCYPLSWLLAATVFAIVYFQGGWLRRRIAQCGMEPEVRV